MPSNRAAFGRLAACLCLGLLLTLLLCACHRSETSARSAGSDPAPAPNGRLLVGFDADFPPFSFVDDEGRQAGFDYELAGAVCAAQGWEFVPVFMSWDEKDDLLDSGQIDCIWSCFSITSRENDYAWSVPYLDNQFVVVTRDALPIRKLADLADRRVCVQSSTSLANILVGEYAGLTATFSELCLMDDNETAMLYLTAGKTDACVLDLAAAGYFLSRYDGQLRLLSDVLSNDQCGVAFRRGDARAETVSRALQAMQADGSLAALADKWELGALVRAGS
jgi:polar amino acid transport system substrate-binding protein